MSNSSLIVHTNLSPNHSGQRNHKIDTFTPHVVVGHSSLLNLGAWFAKKTTAASSNYGIDDRGQIAMFVEEKNRSWCTSSGSNDHRAITVEVASDSTHPYAITNGAMDGLIKLGADVCVRNNIPKLLWRADKSLVGKIEQQNITSHRWFAAKACPGDYLFARLGEVADEVNKLLQKNENSTVGLPYIVKVNTDILNYRKGPGTNTVIVGQVRRGEVYTIVEEASGTGASKWGQLKRGTGVVSVDHCQQG